MAGVNQHSSQNFIGAKRGCADGGSGPYYFSYQAVAVSAAC